MLASSQLEILKREIMFRTSRSGGKGGQNVNKVETKVELLFDVNASEGLSQGQKQLILTKLAGRISDEGLLRMTEESSRSQMTNKELVTERFLELIAKALVKPKMRRPTKPTKASRKKNAESKKRKSEKKEWRKKLY